MELVWRAENHNYRSHVVVLFITLGVLYCLQLCDVDKVMMWMLEYTFYIH